jgi:hypothetical protein
VIPQHGHQFGFVLAGVARYAQLLARLRRLSTVQSSYEPDLPPFFTTEDRPRAAAALAIGAALSLIRLFANFLINFGVLDARGPAPCLA